MKERNSDDLHWKSIDYDKVSEVYDEARAGNPEMIRHLLHGSSVKPGLLVLDVGCGTANNTLLFAKVTNALVLGVDLSSRMLRKAHEKAPQLGFIQSSADFLPFRDNIFDFVFMTDVVHHLPALNSALNETHRVLNHGGLICIVTQSHTQIEQRMTSKFFPTTVTVDQARPDIPDIEKAMVRAAYANIHSDAHTLAPFLLSQEYIETLEMKGYSSLHRISEEDFQKGLQAVRAALAHGDELSSLTEYSFVWGTKHSS